MLALWKGRLPLAEAFWFHAILGVAVVNLVATFAGLLVLAEDWPPVLGWLFLVLPLPYGLAAIVGVWRSSARQSGAETFAALARTMALVWGLVFLLL